LRPSIAIPPTPAAIPLFQERCRLTRIEIKEGEQVEASEKKTELLEGIQGFDHFEDRKQG
jgi:hypothetical protein